MKLKRFTTQLVAAGLITVPLMVQAAGLGKMSVNSALGQPLAAEIELFAADRAELESLSASLASDQAFRDANVEFAPVLSSLRFSVETKPNGKSVLKVTSNRPVNDPFVDMLIELNWASGRLVREYTMLLDPPGMAPQQSVAPVVVAPVKPPVTRRAPAADQAPAASKPAAPVAAKAAEPATQPVAAPDQVTVKRGDTLSRIARQVKPAGVSLEQTLVGLYRENPRAFDGNMNRMKADTTLAVPSSEKAASIPQQDAVREIKLQSDDWRAYRQSLAGKVQEAPAAKPAPTQASSGKLTPKVEDRAKPAQEAQKDVLKLSKVTPPATAAAGKLDEKRAAQEKQDKLRALEEDAIARQKALKESEQRAAMLEKQIQDAQKLIEMKEKANAAAAAAPGPAVVAVAPVVPAPTPAPVVPKPAPVAAVEAPVESTENWFTPLLANPLYWGGALVALGLGGALWWMMAGGGGRRRKTGTALDDSIMSGGDVRPTSVIGGAASGGSINTGDTSFLTDFSQAGLGTIDTHDVDPIAEAEVYMAYGRDAQAEEILKEAISKNPDRPEVRVKLLEVYAARRNTAAFESVAGELYAALGNKQSPLWDKACEMGRSIDPTNPLYGGVQSAAPAVAVGTVVAATDVIAGGAVAVEPEPFAAAPFGAAADEMKEADIEPVPESDPVTNAPLEFESAGHVLNFDAQPAATAAPTYQEADTHGLDFDLPDLDLPASATDDSKLDLDLDLGLEEDNGPVSKFDFSGLDLDLGDSGGNELELDEVGTKLDLARAYVEMGDKEGAREILTEVLAEGSDKQIADAKGLMSSLA
ncbi:MAG: hypothetical protein B7Z35_14950 [Hydrogenophilales bacterium 12-61-10]|nr:MAG: hypothetical protein B7Z35_14950 [Hydrogenophilales bacterium 12-61-10]OYX30195.1 MAG: hypothetical protein B7Z03_06735 [Hydrogenophilales bacterium 32-62-9]